jgi:hypothetical protein
LLRERSGSRQCPWSGIGYVGAILGAQFMLSMNSRLEATSQVMRIPGLVEDLAQMGVQLLRHVAWRAYGVDQTR